ncbi:hypothetical protein B6U99_05535 [Candidatus Geothermarchaeota archaeon ex4572_27]|nr:MAG: hypothetical protein B6U99_05535 [Candidatus Geothermarchaeota archaeon ex4572_27]
MYGMLERRAEELRSYRALRAYGLSGYEAKAYIALAVNGPSTAKQVAELANIPYTKVYDTLSKLEAKGMAEAIPGRPMKYRAVPPSEVASVVREHLSSIASQVEGALIEELQPLYESRGAMGPISGVLRRLRDLDAALARMMGGASSRASIHLGWVDAPYLDRLIGQVRAALSRGLEVKALVSRGCLKSPRAKELVGLVEARIARSVIPVNVVVVDGSQAIFTLASMVGGRPSRRLALVISLRELVELIDEYIEMAWSSASEAPTRYRT